MYAAPNAKTPLGQFLELQIIPLYWDTKDTDEATTIAILDQKRTLHNVCLLHYNMDT